LRAKLIETQRRRRAANAAAARAESESQSESETGPIDTEIDQVLDWLEAKGYLSDARFIESRLNARSERHGSIRIRQELSRHGLALSPEQAGQLRETEFSRAREVWRRKFGEVGADPRERARQARFLAARGFPSDIVRRIVGGEDD
jgi:regulatory protein